MERWRWIGSSASILTGCGRERLQRVKDLLAKSEMGAILCFDMNNVRYITSTHIGSWAQDKMSRFTLLTRKSEPILWDFGSAAKHHQLHCPWLGERSRAGFRCCAARCPRKWAAPKTSRKKIRIELEEHGLLHEPLGVDIVEPPILFALQREGIKIVDGQQLMSDARVIKTRDEIALLNTSAMMVDAAYDELYRAMKPGMRENEAVGLVSKVLYDLGSEYVEAVNAISGERCNPHPHVFSRPRAAARRSGVLRHSAFLHGLSHLLLPLLHDRLRIARDD